MFLWTYLIHGKDDYLSIPPLGALRFLSGLLNTKCYLIHFNQCVIFSLFFFRFVFLFVFSTHSYVTLQCISKEPICLQETGVKFVSHENRGNLFAARSLAVVLVSYVSGLYQAVFLALSFCCDVGWRLSCCGWLLIYLLTVLMSACLYFS